MRRKRCRGERWCCAHSECGSTDVAKFAGGGERTLDGSSRAMQPEPTMKRNGALRGRERKAPWAISCIGRRRRLKSRALRHTPKWTSQSSRGSSTRSREGAEPDCVASQGQAGHGFPISANATARRLHRGNAVNWLSTPAGLSTAAVCREVATSGAASVRGRTTPLSNGLSLVRPRPSTINPRGVRYASVRPLRLRLRGDRGRARTRRRLSSGDGPRHKTGASRCRTISPSHRITPSIWPAH